MTCRLVPGFHLHRPKHICFYMLGRTKYVQTLRTSKDVTLTIPVDNIVVNNLFGMSTGLGYLPTTFDWSQIAYNGSPLVVPFWAQANVFAGFFVFIAVLSPILYYTNVWYTSYMPLSGSDSYDNTGAVYNATRIVDSAGNFLPKAYEEYSPIFMPVTFALGYGISFAIMSCVPVHIFLYYHKEIWDTFRGRQKKDVHARIMDKNYKEVPWWWYASMIVIVLVVTIIVQEVYHTEMPVWSVFLAFGMALFCKSLHSLIEPTS